MAMTGQANNQGNDTGADTPSEEEEFGAGFGTESGASTPQDTTTSPATAGTEEEQPSGEEEPSGEEAGGETPSGEEAGGEQPSAEQVTTGDGGTPADHGQPSQPFDADTLRNLVQEAVRGEQSGGAQQGEQQSGQQSGGEEPAVPKDWTEYLTEEERTALNTYDQEWGEVSEAEKIRTQAMVRHARDSVLNEVQNALGPIVQHLQQSEQASHFDQIRSQHEDFDQIRNGPLQEWVQGMSNSVVKKAAEDVLQQGTTQEVIELVDMYKEDKGIARKGSQSGQSTGAAPGVPASSQAPAQSSQQGNQQGKGKQKPPKPNVDPEAASATAAVTTGSRGADPRGDDPDDFQAGFAETASG